MGAVSAPVLDLDADRADVDLWVEASRTCGLPTIKRPVKAEASIS
jgi:hypothetical protein